ncbi:MAG: MBL fold metallo-hydrolase [Acidobacteriota bacterium]|nr:MBL fold metallo-hydrolase [Acidobacteriota bacterium]MDQ7088420.1 MBL fold metallo-hydrolase [Acidobacteriota bacterium]
MRVETIPVGPLQVNCYLITDPDSGKTLVVDPGEDARRVAREIREARLEVCGLLATHGHFDHVGGVARLKALLDDVPFFAHREDLFLIDSCRQAAARWNLEVDDCPAPDHFLEDGEILEVGALRLEVRHTPGHSPGGVTLVGDGRIFPGDTLFRRSVGRTDFRGGDAEKLATSIRERLYTLADETRVHPGHGPVTTIGEEKRENPFVRG